MQPSRDISRLIEIMAALRDKETGCPWDLEQDFSSIRHYTIEEAYEVADAIERGDIEDLREELGDLLLQPIFHAQMASEAGHFDIGDVIHAITSKLIRRHPHVFGEQVADDARGAQSERARNSPRRSMMSPMSSPPSPARKNSPSAPQRSASTGPTSTR
jgi:ATP diphosphatase